MRIYRLVFVCIAFAGLVCACSSEKPQVTAYLKAVDSYDEELNALRKGMRQEASGMRADNFKNFKIEAVRRQAKDMLAKIEENKTKLEELSVPAKAQSVHEGYVARYEMMIEGAGLAAELIEIMAPVLASEEPDAQQLGELAARAAPMKEKAEALRAKFDQNELILKREREKLVKELELTDDVPGIPVSVARPGK